MPLLALVLCGVVSGEVETFRRLDILASAVLAIKVPRFFRPLMVSSSFSGGGGDTRFSYSTCRLGLRWSFLASLSWINCWLVAWSYPIKFIK